MSIATPSPPDRPTGNGQRLTALAAGIRAITPIPTQGQGGSFRRTPGGYTTPPRVNPSTPRLPWTFYLQNGNLHLSPGLLNGLPLTTEDGDPLDDLTPPPLITEDELTERKPAFLFELQFAPIFGTLYYAVATDEGTDYIPYAAILGGTPLTSRILVRDVPADFVFPGDFYTDYISPVPETYTFIVGATSSDTERFPDFLNRPFSPFLTPEWHLGYVGTNPITDPLDDFVKPRLLISRSFDI